MNFKNIQNLFIGVFVLLNIFLFTVYRDSRVKIDSLTSQAKSNIDYRLRKDDIEVKKLSNKQQKGYYLSAKKEDLQDKYQKSGYKNISNLQGNEIKVDISDNLTLNKNVTESKLNQFVADNLSLYRFVDYSYVDYLSSFEKKQGQATFVQSYQDLPFLDDDSLLSLDFEMIGNSYQLISFSQNYLVNINPLREAQELISEKEAIITLYNQSKIPEQSKINRLELGYTKIIELDDEYVYVPTWLVGIKFNKTNKTEKINAVNGTIITETTLTKIE